MHNKSKYGRHFPQTAVPCSQEKSTVFSTSPITIATVHEIHLQLVFSVVIVALCLLFCKLFFLFFTYRIKIHSICLNSHGIPFSNESPAFCFYLCSVTGFELCDLYKTICIFCIFKYSGNFICEAESSILTAE